MWDLYDTWELYETKLKAYGETKRDRQLEQAREDFYREAVGNPAYHKALRNGVEEDFLIQRTDKTERFKITAFPGNELNIGDYIEVFDETFLVYQTRVQDTLNRTGILWLCNHKFRWQNFSSEIIERWGVLDSGVYSTTIRGEADLRYKNKQFKLILPLDEETQKLYIDKRIAVDKMFDSRGNEILNVYQITGYDATGENFGQNAHILYCNLRSDEFNPNTDNVDEVICDYISPDGNTVTDETLLECEITGPSEIRLGSKRKYSAVFYDAERNIVTDIVPIWSAGETAPTIDIYKDGDKYVIDVPDDLDLLGESVEIHLTADGYNTASRTITTKGL